MVQPLAEIEEVCMFKDDGSVIHIPRPAAGKSFHEQVLLF